MLSHTEQSTGEFDLDSKLVLFDAFALGAVDDIIVWLTDHPEDLIAVARGRHVVGHYRFQEEGLFEYDEKHLLAEMAEELADAIVYGARRKFLLTKQSVGSSRNKSDEWVQPARACCGDPGDCGDCQ